jgi:hypothetical protein
VAPAGEPGDDDARGAAGPPGLAGDPGDVGAVGGGGGVLGSSLATPSPNRAAPTMPPATANAIRWPEPPSDDPLESSPDPDPPGGTGPIEGTGLTPPGPTTRNPVTLSGVGPVATGTGDGVGLGLW